MTLTAVNLLFLLRHWS